VALLALAGAACKLETSLQETQKTFPHFLWQTDFDFAFVLAHFRPRRICPPERTLVSLVSNQSIDHSASEYPGKLWMASMRIAWMILQASDIR
jgi:hypothetical protein